MRDLRGVRLVLKIIAITMQKIFNVLEQKMLLVVGALLSLAVWWVIALSPPSVSAAETPQTPPSQQNSFIPQGILQKVHPDYLERANKTFERKKEREKYKTKRETIEREHRAAEANKAKRKNKEKNN